MDDRVAHAGEDGASSLDVFRRSARHDQKGAFFGMRRRPADGSIHGAFARSAQPIRQLVEFPREYGAHLDEKGAVAEPCGGTVRAEHRGLDDLAPREHRDHEIGPDGSVPGRGGRHGAASPDPLECAVVGVERPYIVPARDQVARHGKAHHADADKADRAHLVPSGWVGNGDPEVHPPQVVDDMRRSRCS